MVTLKYMNLLLQLYTPSKCQIYNNWTVHEHKCLSSFLFFRFPSNWEREREYINLGKRRNIPKGTYLFFWRGSTGESFFFYGLIDFILFLTLAWRKWLLHVSQNFFVFFYPEYLAFGSVSYEPCPTTDFLTIYFRWQEGVPTSVLGSQPIIWLLSPSLKEIILEVYDNRLISYIWHLRNIAFNDTDNAK